jgi:nicotinamide-nucleotide amidase
VDCELLSVGTELLLGFTVDTNAAVLGSRLAEAGIAVRRRATVGDVPADITGAVRAALARTGLLIISGGLGPTSDDLTVSAVAAALDRRLVRDAGIVARLEDLYRRRGLGMPAANLRQADVPEGATILPNPIGTAPGVWIDHEGKIVVLLPGVPKEMQGLLEREVLPRLRHRGGAAPAAGTVVRSRTIRTTGIAESALADLLGHTQPLLGEGLTLAFIPSVFGTDLRITAWNLAADAATTALARSGDALRARAGPHVYGEGADDLAAVVVQRLEAEGATLAVAESCTGGGLGARLTAVPGSSRVFVGGVIAYADDVKLAQLGVSAELLREHGAVSEPVAREMAEAVALALGADAGLAVTGIAGPDGGSPAKPVGTVWIAARWRDRTRTFTYVFPGDREDVRQRAAQWALDLLRRIVTGVL